VLCDELSAQLVNSSTGDHFRRYMEECRTHKTVVFVTHRQDWLALADNVIWLKPDERPIITKPEPLLGQLARNNR
jgi:ABC-type transport system involved in cytochrome bd biosynthesis fused ATPase/permease subunit